MSVEDATVAPIELARELGELQRGAMKAYFTPPESMSNAQRTGPRIVELAHKNVA